MTKSFSAARRFGLIASLALLGAAPHRTAPWRMLFPSRRLN